MPGCGPHHDDAQAVREDVVQLPGDPRSLGGGGVNCPGLLVAFGPFSTILLA